MPDSRQKNVRSVAKEWRGGQRKNCGSRKTYVNSISGIQGFSLNCKQPGWLYDHVDLSARDGKCDAIWQKNMSANAVECRKMRRTQNGTRPTLEVCLAFSGQPTHYVRPEQGRISRQCHGDGDVAHSGHDEERCPAHGALAQARTHISWQQIGGSVPLAVCLDLMGSWKPSWSPKSRPLSSCLCTKIRVQRLNYNWRNLASAGQVLGVDKELPVVIQMCPTVGEWQHRKQFNQLPPIPANHPRK